MKRLKYIFGAMLTFTLTQGAFAQEKPNYSASAGSFAVGISFSPTAAGHIYKMTTGDDLGAKLVDISQDEYQMKFLGTTPVASLSFKYMLSNNLAVSLSYGFDGMSVDYRENVLDDKAYYANPETSKQTADQVKTKINTGTVQAGIDYLKGDGNWKLSLGGQLVYAYGGGKSDFSYGNALNEYNSKPTINSVSAALNDWQDNGDIAFARPIKRYNIGYEQGLGLRLNIGVEYFFIPKASVSATMSILPIMYAWQPETFTTYEGYSSLSSQVIKEYTVQHSSGSQYVMYGTETFGLSVALHYYF